MLLAHFYSQFGLWNPTLERGWTFCYTLELSRERCRTGVGILTSPWLYMSVLEFSLANERADSLQLHDAGGKVLTMVYAHAPNISSDYLAFLESFHGVLEGVAYGDSLVQLGDFNSHVGNDSYL